MRSAALLIVALLLLPACAERRIRVTSEPPGARVWLNDEDIGRTPTEARFTFYGHYDLRLELEGHEPYHARHTARAPLHEYPGPDLVAAAIPANIRHLVEWHIELSPTPESTLEPETVRLELIDRAGELRERALRD
ncbi:MAG: PEGA domain-containing protein [Phycisphaerales bacterium]|nr:PEGA domain-containing protein [Planctomycetota bacterium]MCH8509313.1 PEGA domain-containing protein [Phycisphaerales bacterium]